MMYSRSVGKAFSQADGWGSNPGSDRLESLKQVVTAPLPNARQQVLVPRVLGDGHINGCPVHVYDHSMLKNGNRYEC